MLTCVDTDLLQNWCGWDNLSVIRILSRVSTEQHKTRTSLAAEHSQSMNRSCHCRGHTETILLLSRVIPCTHTVFSEIQMATPEEEEKGAILLPDSEGCSPWKRKVFPLVSISQFPELSNVRQIPFYLEYSHVFRDLHPHLQLLPTTFTIKLRWFKNCSNFFLLNCY